MSDELVPGELPAAKGCFVTGTDTGVGKTLMSCALLHAYALRGARVIGMKPVAAGADRVVEELVNDDVRQLQAASTIDAPPAWVNPYCFEHAVAPHVAAAMSGARIDLGRIQSAYHRLARAADIVVVEGVGGFRVPLNHEQDSADLCCLLNLPLILVVGMRLGCLNHALLTIEAARARGLTVAGWIANQIDARMQMPEENLRALADRLTVPLMGRCGYEMRPDSRAIASRLDLAVLDRCFES